MKEWSQEVWIFQVTVPAASTLLWGSLSCCGYWGTSLPGFFLRVQLEARSCWSELCWAPGLFLVRRISHPLTLENILDWANDVQMLFKHWNCNLVPLLLFFFLFFFEDIVSRNPQFLGLREDLRINIQRGSWVLEVLGSVRQILGGGFCQQQLCRNTLGFPQKENATELPRNSSQNYLGLAASHSSAFVILECLFALV